MKGPDGRYMFGASKVGERGQVVIPKEARDLFNIKPGDMMLMLGDENGIAMIKLDVFQDMANNLLCGILPAKAAAQGAAKAEAQNETQNQAQNQTQNQAQNQDQIDSKADDPL